MTAVERADFHRVTLVTALHVDTKVLGAAARRPGLNIVWYVTAVVTGFLQGDVLRAASAASIPGRGGVRQTGRLHPGDGVSEFGVGQPDIEVRRRHPETGPNDVLVIGGQ